MSNLAFRGVKAVLDEYSNDDVGALQITIDKRLPVAAGIAGGSGNAAACMLGMNALMGNPLSLRELMHAGASVGADVPFSLLMNAYANRAVLGSGGKGLKGIEEASLAAWTGGIGDVVEPVSPLKYYVIMANPGIAVSTKAAYEAIDAINGEGKAATGELFVNDFEAYTLNNYPEAARLRSVMQRQLGAETILMSGSGPTMAAYYTDRSKAEAGFALMKEIADREHNWRTWLTQTGFEESGTDR